MMIITCKISTLDGHNGMKNFVAAVYKDFTWWLLVCQSHFLRVQIASCHFLNGTFSATQTKSGISNFNLPLTALPWLQLGQKTWQVTYSNNDNSPPRAASHYVASH